MAIFNNCYGETIERADLPSGDNSNLFALTVGTVFQFVENGKVRKNAKHFRVTGRQNAQCVDFEDNLYRSARVFYSPVSKKTGEIERDYHTGRKIESYDIYDAGRVIAVNVVS